MSEEAISYILLADHFGREEGDGFVRYSRGDSVELTDEFATNLLRCAAVAKPGSVEASAALKAPGVRRAVAAPVEADEFNQSAYGAAFANSGLQSTEEVQPEGTAKRPPKAAAVDAWRQYAADSGQLSKAEADELTKAELIELVE